MKKGFLFVFILSLGIISTCFANEALLKEASAGNAEAQFKVAALYATGKLGNKTSEDRKKMFEWLEKSAEHNYLKAQETLCKQYLDRCNFEGAYKWAKKAMEQNSNIGKATMAYLLYWGENVVPIDKVKAYSLIKECSSEPLAKTLLGMFYSEGWFDFEADFDKAVKLAKEAAEKNCGKAYLLLWSLYYKEYFKTKDEKIKKKLYEAVEDGMKKNPFDIEIKLGYASNLLMISESEEDHKKGKDIVNEILDFGKKEASILLYIYELTHKGDSKKAFEFLEKTAEEYCSDSSMMLFELYIMGKNGNGVQTEINLKKAREIALKAISFNNQKFLEKYIPMYNLAKINADFKKTLGEAFIEDFDLDKYIKVAADNGSPAMMYLYSHILPKGELKQKYETGAANCGWTEAQGMLSVHCFMEKDYEGAYSWAKKANEKGDYMGANTLGQCMLMGYGNCEIEEEKGLNLILDSIARGAPIITIGLAYKKYIDEQNTYQIYFLSQIYLKSISPNQTGMIEAINENIDYTKNMLSQEEIEKADNEANRILRLNLESAKNLLRRNLTNYGITHN